MGPYPSLSDYNAAVLSPRKAFADPLLARGRVEVGGFGMPLVLSGGFALTYRVHCPGRKQFAVRCFQDDQPGRAERYRILAEWMRRTRASSGGDSSCWVDTEFQPDGIRIGGSCYPIVKMDWVVGKTLGALIEERHRNAGIMDSLRRKMRRLAISLEEQGAAHGDVQNGNIFWTAAGLRLIDYDGMFAPGMEAMPGSEAGHPNFQHPQRTLSHYGAGIDRFSFILYELSLRTLSRNPGFYERFSTGENILFSRPDMQNPGESDVFRTLETEPGLERDIALFRQICEAPFQEVPSLSEYLLELSTGKVPSLSAAGKRKAQTAAQSRVPSAAPGRSFAREYAGPYPVFDARDYPKINTASGHKVEVVGRVEGVKEGLTRYDKPYVFINFGRWRQNIFQITIWAEGLECFRIKPDDALVGKWVSVAGLVDQPYTNEKFGYTHAGITVHHPSQMRTISPDESAYRLGRSGKPRDSVIRGGVPKAGKAIPVYQRESAPAKEATATTDRSTDSGSSIDNRALIQDLFEGNSRAPRTRRCAGDRIRPPLNFRPPKRLWRFVLRIAGGVLVIGLVYLVVRVLLR